ncbi:esterase-like activity of phytase family protein [Dichotomicrobium thermohalophilum]|uniref:Phytase-like domain-containing protein n=1 Tax=Dichotomicrobium thermohalophilum TaxID=933063 RepID=A0A397Q472_9HYPH|nr:esterase-like activity of phytase family protein [Dichotomicrobium thermohalophilum]RIA55209.1 hypothetical protein BXY53_0268 [Dichotomicrobium thermohalophilum]
MARHWLWAAALLITLTGGNATAEPRDVRVDTRPLILDYANPQRKRFGKLTWLGGLVLRSSAGPFGGYSGLAVSADGSELLAISDRTSWLKMRVEERGGQLIDVRDAVIGKLVLRDEWDNPEVGRGLNDAEGLAALEPGVLAGDYYIVFEGKHRIHRYEFDGTNFSAPVGALELPPAALRLPDNKALESLAILRDGPYEGAAIAFSERRAHISGDSLGWLFHEGRVEQIRLKRSRMFDITDAAALPDGGLVVLERNFAGIMRGVFMRIRRIDAADIKPGARLDGEVLYETEDGRMVDNMEAIAVHTDAEGRTILTVMSDDNYNPVQRTLLMRFAME